MPIAVQSDEVPQLSPVVTAVSVAASMVGAVALPATPSSHPQPIYAIGDSWAAGLYADPTHALIQDAADDLGTTADVDGQSGSGYLVAPPGTATYPERATRIPAGPGAALVIVQGGSNDVQSDLSTLPDAVARTVAGIQAVRPHASVVLLGPGPDPWPVTGVQRQVDDTLAAEAANLGVRYISPLREGWFTADDVDDIIDPATHHPTAVGDAVLGAELAAELRNDAPRPQRPRTSAWLPSLPQRAARARRAGRPR
ncbi:SGNH/GDSL hydrolase family protein [Amnibacterium sp.]|uniref:SGNH/GDSL hydrolase family protein n=1 Tax=Amnibacterium sp. TaxID=1872496 RepID=UPI0026043F7E|nr:SGNH/GDSL hydrolase family protein [Amnibacterium sp.]MCU1475203.1 hydrolase family protein [Amnibacterium sp.]